MSKIKPFSPDANYVAREQKICQICGHKYTADRIFLHKRGKSIPDKQTITGYGLCPDHQELFDNNYLALVVIKNKPSETSEPQEIKPAEADRTGEIIHIKRNVFAELMTPPVSPELPMIYIDQVLAAEFIEMHNNAMQKATDTVLGEADAANK